MDSTEWPDRFIYVCSATQAAIVNTLPIKYAGIGRIVRFYVLCGASSIDTKDPGERREAADPTARLYGFVKDAALHLVAAPRFEPLFGDPDDFSVWQNHMRGIVTDEKNDGLPIVFAVTGGRKTMTIGALQGAAHGDRDRLRFVNVRGRPLRVEFIEGILNQDGSGIRQTNAVQHDRLSLDDYLEVYGVREVDPAGRRAQEQRYRDWQSQIEAFALLCLDDPLRTTPTLNWLVSSLFNERGEFLGGAIDLAAAPPDQQTQLRAMFDELAGMEGIEKSGENRLSITTEQAGWLLLGGWLEAYIFNRIEALVAGSNDVEIRANLRLTQHQHDSAEIDLALYIRDQLHIVEAKTANFGNRAAHASGGQSLSQVDTVKRHLLAQHGHAWVVNPRETKHRLDRGPGDFIPRAQSTGIELLVGRDAVNELVGHVRKLLT